MNKIATVSRSFGKVGLFFKKNWPTMAVIGGTISMGAGAVLACVKTPEVSEEIKKANTEMEFVKEAKDEGKTKAGNEYTLEDYKYDRKVIALQTSKSILKAYWLPALLEIGGAILIMSGHGVMKKRYVAVSTVLASTEKAFEEYRSKVKDEFGEDVDKKLRYNTITAETEVDEVDENGNVKKVKKKVEVIDKKNIYSQYAKFFDEGSPYFTKNPETNLLFLRAQQNYANDLLRARGHLFLSEVYDMLGIPRTQDSIVVGWIYEPDNPDIENYVDFGIYDFFKEKARDFVNGYEPVLLLDFNVQGNIHQLI